MIRYYTKICRHCGCRFETTKKYAAYCSLNCFHSETKYTSNKCKKKKCACCKRVLNDDEEFLCKECQEMKKHFNENDNTCWICQKPIKDFNFRYYCDNGRQHKTCDPNNTNKIKLSYEHKI